MLRSLPAHHRLAWRTALVGVALAAAFLLALQFTPGNSAVESGTAATFTTQNKFFDAAPGALAAGDVVIVQVVMVPATGSTLAYACPSNSLTWTKIARTTSGTLAMETFWARSSAAAAAANYRFEIHTVSGCTSQAAANDYATSGGALKFSGVIASGSPVNQSAGAASSGAVTSLNAPTVTTTYADTRILRFFGWASNGNITGSDTATYSTTSTSGTNRAAALFDRGTQAAAGATGTYTGSGASGVAAAQTIALIPAPRLVFTTAARAGTVSVCISDPMQVQFQNEAGSAANNQTGAAVTVSLSTNKTGTFYSDSSCTTSITSVSVANGSSSSPDFYYKGTATGGGIHTVTASASTLTNTPATQNVSVKANQTITFNQPTTPAAYAATFTVSPTSTSGLTVSVAASGGCTLSGSTVTMTSPTTSCVLTASQAGNVEYFAATDVVRTVAATKANQTITFTQPTTPAGYNTTFTVAPTSTSTLSVAVVASGGCQVDNVSSGTYTIRMTSSTTACSLTASQDGDSNYNAATDVTRTVAAAKASQTITFAQPDNVPATAPYDSTFTISATASSGLTVSFAVSGGCSLNGTSVTMTSSTTACTITASQAGDTDYLAAANVVRTVTTGKADQSITFTQPSTPAPYNSTFVVSPTSSSGLTVTIVTTGGCSIDTSSGGNYTIRMTSVSTACTLTASQSGNTFYNAAPNVVRTVNGQKADQATLSVTGPSSARYGTAATLTSSGGSTGLTVTYTRVSGTGCSLSGSTVTVLEPTGSCSVTATMPGNTNYNEVTSAPYNITLQKAEQSITFTQPTTPAVYNSTFSIAPTASSNLTVSVSVSGGCQIDGSSGGSTTIRMTSASDPCVITGSQSGDSYYNAASSVSRTVNGAKAAQATLVVSGPGTVTYGSPGTLTTTGGTTGGSVSYTRVSGNGCTVSGSTITVTDATDSCSVTATMLGNANYNDVTSAARTITLQKADQTISFTTPIPSGLKFGETYSPAATASSGLTVSFSTSNGAVCSYYYGSNTVTMNSKGTCSVLANQPGNNNYNAAPQTSQSFGVGLANQAPIHVAGPASVAYGVPGTLTYTGGTTGLPVIYAAGSSTGCSVSGTTVTVTNGTGTCFVTVTMPGNDSYADVTSEPYRISLGRLAQAQLRVVSPGSLTYGSSVAVTWEGGTTGGVVTISANTSTGCSVNGVMLTVTNASGTCVVVATMEGNGTYEPVNSAPWNVQLVKKEQLLIITSPPPASVGIGGVYVPEITFGGSTSPVVITANGACEFAFGAVRMKRAGTCNVIASQDGDSNYLPAIRFLQSFEVSSVAEAGPGGPLPGELPFRSFIPGIMRD